jgi:hypothetical protein
MNQVKNSFEIQLTELIDSQVMIFINKISEKCNLDKDELFALWKEKDSLKEEKPVKKKVNEKVGNICIYVTNTGSKCTTKIRGEGNLCSKHKSKSKVTKNTEKSVENNIDKSKILRMHKKLKKYYHPETGFVFKSKDEKIVIGKIQDENIEKLNLETINECKSWGFAYDFCESDEE